MSRKRCHDIYEATEQEYDTSDYRRKMCHRWISNVQTQSVPLRTPTNLDMNAPATTQMSHKHQKYINCTQTKIDKHREDTQVDDFLNDDAVDFMEPLSDYLNQPLDNAFRASNSNNRPKHTVHKINSAMKPTAEPANLNYHSADRRPKRRHQETNGYFDEDFDFGLDFQSEDFKRPENDQRNVKKQKKEKSYVEPNEFEEYLCTTGQKSSSGNAEKYDLVRKSKPTDEYGKDPSRHLIFKRVKERSVAELLDATPVWKIPDADPLTDYETGRKEYQELSHKRSNDRHALQMHERYENKHRMSKSGKHVHDHQYVVSNELQEFEHPIIKPTKAFQALKALSSHTTTQPIIFNIKCNNLIIKTD